MSETVARQRPSVDLDDFERRLESQTRRQHAHEDDPLAELARIVGDQSDPYGDVFAHQAAGRHDELRPSYAPHGRQEPSLGAQPSLDVRSSVGSQSPRLSADFAAIEAGLRGATSFAANPPGPQAVYAQEPEAQYDTAQYDAPPQSRAEPARAQASRGGSRRPVYMMAATMAIGVLGIGATFAYKGAGSSPREIKTIMAAVGPSKEQPPVDQAAAMADQDAGASQQASTKLVSREEQPVDLQQAVQDNAAARGAPDAANVPVPPSPGQAAGTASPDYAALGGATPDNATTGSISPAYNDQGGFGVGMPKPKRVKSVSVTPDGRIVDGGATPNLIPSAPPSLTTKMSDRAGPVTASLTKNSKHAAKAAASAPVADAQPSSDNRDNAAVAPAPKSAKPAKKAKPVRVASTETGAAEATETAAPATATATEETAPAGSGGFAVQLAAPTSEADAKSATSRFLKKYSSALSGRRLGFHRADSNGRTVYRVRVSSLTKEDATSLCSKLKADGGSCFVAKN